MVPLRTCASVFRRSLHPVEDGNVTSKERILLALHREKPDRLPVSVHQWQGYHLQTYMGGISDIEAFAATGMDALIQYFQSMGQFWLVDADFSKTSTPQWRDDVQVLSNDPDHRKPDT